MNVDKSVEKYMKVGNSRGIIPADPAVAFVLVPLHREATAVKLVVVVVHRVVVAVSRAGVT